MKQITVLFISVVVLTFMTGRIWAETPQHKWVGDVPIMPSLTIEKGLGFAFDNADGRIVTIYLSGEMDKKSITTYYTQALDPLGWQRKGNSKWARGNEMLEIKETQAAGIALWKITLRPQ